MKNTKKLNFPILVVFTVIIAAIALAACSNPSGTTSGSSVTTPDPCEDGHDFVDGECTLCGADDFPTAAGLYLGAPADLTSASVPIVGIAANDVAAAVDRVILDGNENNGAYTLLLSANVEVDDQQSLNVDNRPLTIIGIGGERTISRTENGVTFSIAQWATVTIGNNITLRGREGNNNPVVTVNTNATFIMLDGSKITGNVMSGSGDNGAGVSVANATFHMNGGDITGNTNNGGAFANLSTGGLSVSGTGQAQLNGGSITGNTGRHDDVLVSANYQTRFRLSGDAKVGKLSLNASASERPSINITSEWTGSVGSLSLAANTANFTGTGNTVIGWWAPPRTVLSGTVDASVVSKFAVVQFMNNAGDTQPISPTHVIDAGGVLQAVP